MSERADALAEVIEKAVGEWLAEHGGGFLTGFALSVEYVDEDGDNSWATGHGPRQTFGQTLGMLEWHRVQVDAQARRYLAELAADD